jgi:hypothetical protein
VKVNFKLNHWVLFSILTMSFFLGCVAAIAESNTTAGETDLFLNRNNQANDEKGNLAIFFNERVIINSQ